MSGKPLPKLTPRKAPPTLGSEGVNGPTRDALLSTSPNSLPSLSSRSPNLSQLQDPSIPSTSSIARSAPSSAFPAPASPLEQENEQPFAPPSVPVKPYPPRLTLRPRGPSSSKSDGQGLGLSEASHPLSPFTFSFDAADATSTSLSSATSSSPARTKAGPTKKKSVPAPSSVPPTDFTLSDPQFFPRKYHKNQKSAASSRPDSQYSTYTASSAKDAMIRTASREKLQKGSAKFRERPTHEASPGEHYGDEDGWEEGDMMGHNGGSSSGSEYDPDERDAYDEHGPGNSPSGHRSTRNGKAAQLSLPLGSGSSTAGGMTQSLSPTSPVRSRGESTAGSPSQRLLPTRDPSSSNMARSATAPHRSSRKNRLSGSSKANSVLSIRMPAQRPPLARTASGAQSVTGRRSLSMSTSVFTVEDLPLPETYLPGQWAESPSAYRAYEPPYKGDARDEDQEEDANLMKLAAFSFPHAALESSTMDDSIQSYQSSAGVASTSTASGVTGQSSRRLRWKEAIAYAQQREREAAGIDSASHSKVISVTDDSSGLPATDHFNREGSQSRASVASRQHSMTGGHSTQASIDRILTTLQASTPATAPVPFSKESFLSSLLSSQATAEVSATFPSQSVFESVEDFENAKKELVRLQNRLVDKKNKLRTMKRLRGARGKLVKAASSERGGGGGLSTSGSQESGLVVPGRSRSNTINPAAAAAAGAPAAPSAASLAGGLFPLVPPTPRFSHSHNLSHGSNSSATSAQPYSLSAVGTSNEALDAATAQVDQIMEEVLSLQERVGALKSRIREHIAIVLLKRCEELEKGGRTREVVFVRGGHGGEDDEGNDQAESEEEGGQEDDEPPFPAQARSARERQPQQRQADLRYQAPLIDAEELSALRSQVQELSESKDREAHALQEVQHLRSQLDLFGSQSEELASVQAREARSLQEVERLRSELELIKSAPAPMTDPKSKDPSLVQTKDVGTSQQPDKEMQLEDLRAQLDLTKLEYEERCANQEADLKRIRDELASAQGSAGVAEEKVRETQAQLIGLEGEHETLRLRHEELGGRHEDLQGRWQELEGRHLDLQSQQKELVSARDVGQAESADRSVGDQRRDADYQQREQDLISRHAAALSEVRQALEHHQAEAKAVRGELSATQSRAEAYDSELASARAKVAQLEEAVRACESSAKQEIQELNAALEKARSDAQDLRAEIATLYSELDSSHKVQNSLSTQVSTLQSEVDAHNARSASQAQAVRDAVAQHDSLELAVTAERRIMAERDALFHAFEARLERAEAVLREQDKRCAALLGKAEGREELDDFLAKIRGGGIKKADKTAGQDIDALLESLGVHVEDLADELDRRGRGRSASVFSLSNTEDLMGRPHSMGQGGGAGTSVGDDEQAAAAIAELEDKLEESQYEVIKLRGELQSSRIQLEAMSTAVNVPQQDHAAEREKDARLAQLQRELGDLHEELASVKSEAAAAAAANRKRAKSPVGTESGEDEHSSLVKVAGSDHEGDIVKTLPKYPTSGVAPPAELIRDLFVALQDVLPTSLDANVAKGDDMKALQTALEAPATSQSKAVVSPTRPLHRGRAAFDKPASPASTAPRPGFGATTGGSVRDLVRNFSGGGVGPTPSAMTPSTSAKSFNSLTSTSSSSTTGAPADDASLSAIVDRARLTLMAAKVATQKAISIEVTREELQTQLKEARSKGEEYRQAIEGLKSRSAQDQWSGEAATPASLAPASDFSSPRAITPARRGLPADPLPQLRTSGLKIGPLPSRSVDSVLDPFNDSSTASFPSATSGNGTGSGASTPFGAALSTAPSSATRRTSTTVARSRLKPLNSAAFLSNSNTGTGGSAGYGAGGSSQPGSSATSPTRSFEPLPTTPGEGSVPLTPTFGFGLGMGHPSSAPSDPTQMRRSVSARPAVSGPSYNGRSFDKTFGSGGTSGGAGSSSGTPTNSAVPQRSITLGLTTSQLVSRIRTLETSLAASHSHSSPHSHSHASQWSLEQVSRLEKSLEAKEVEVRALKDEVGRVREEEGVQKARLMEELNNLQEEMARQSKSKSKSDSAAVQNANATATAKEGATQAIGSAAGAAAGTTLLKAPSPLMLATQSVRSTSPFAAWMGGGSSSSSGAGGASSS